MNVPSHVISIWRNLVSFLFKDLGDKSVPWSSFEIPKDLVLPTIRLFIFVWPWLLLVLLCHVYKVLSLLRTKFPFGGCVIVCVGDLVISKADDGGIEVEEVFDVWKLGS